jgi:iron complex outermembrane receptor protein
MRSHRSPSPAPRSTAGRRTRTHLALTHAAAATRTLAIASLAFGGLHAALPTLAFAQALDGRAQEAPRSFRIEAGPLGQVLTAFASAAGVELTVDAQLLQGRQSTGLNGPYAVREGFAEILRGQGLQAVRAANGSYSLAQAPANAAVAAGAQGAAAATLPVVRVTAQSESESATGPVSGYVAQRSTSGSKTDVPLREVPQSISVVTRDSIDARGSTSLAEALEYTPGFTPMTYGQDDRYDWSIARGIGSTSGANYLDGLKLAGSMYSVPRQEMYGVERVEFLRGPASTLFGSAVPGGVVNAISKRPTPQARGEARVQAGNFDRRSAAADLSGPLNAEGTVMYRFVALNQRHDLQTPQTQKDARYFAPSLAFRLGRDTDLTVLASHQQDRIDGDAYPYSYSESAGRYLPVAEKGWDRFNRDQSAVGVLLDHRFSDNLSVHSRNRQSKTRLDYRLSTASGELSPTLLSRSAQYIKDDAKVWQSDTYLEAKWAVGGWQHTTLFGADLSNLEGGLYRGDAESTPYDTTTGRGVGTFVEPVLSPTYIGTTRQRGVYVQDQVKINERFVLLGGLRQDRYRQNLTGDWAGDPIRHSKLTGRVGAVWLLPSGVSPYASYATSFEPQSGASFDGNPFKPTTGRQMEVGVRIEPKDLNARFTAALFDIQQQNVLTADPSQTGFSVQRGEIGSRGVELEANVSATRNVDLTASYSFTDARVTRDTDPTLVGRRNGLVPRHKLTAWADWRLPPALLDGLSLGLGARANSEVPDFDNTRWVPGVTVFDARVGYRKERWEFALNFRNLLDKTHLVNCSYGSCYPAAQRAVVGSASYHW